MRHTYLIDDQEFSVDVQSQEEFFTGSDHVLSELFGDLAKCKAWYDQGYQVVKTGDFFDSVRVRNELQRTVKNIVQEINPVSNLSDFSLETYHHYVNDDEHNKVIGRTRRLFPRDLGFDSAKIVSSLASYMKSELSYSNPVSKSEQWIIVRINRPDSIGYNPVHKDIYEIIDCYKTIPKMINVWIPICGVTNTTGLPLAPGSHLISEAKIKRTKAGSILNDQKYSVNSILNWGGSSSLEVVSPNSDEMLVFSSHLIHGLGVNHNLDTTRVSLEFRLYECQDFVDK